MPQNEEPNATLSTVTDPKISVVMPCFNACATIAESLRSISSQEPKAYEVLAQDGQSNDGTLDILRYHDAEIDVVSEPDAGQTDALNRALRRATGDVIGWLNADDVYLPGAFRRVSDAFKQHPSADLVYGDFALIDGEGHRLRRYHVSAWDWERFLRRGYSVWSGATFFHRRVFERFGEFDPTLHYCMDLEYMLRIGRSIEAIPIPEVLGAFRIHNASKSGGIPFRFLREAHTVRRKYSRGSARLRVAALIADGSQLTYLCTRRIWLSRAWSTMRSEKRL